MKNTNDKLDLLSREISALRALINEHIENKASPPLRHMCLDRLIMYLKSQKAINLSKSTIYKMSSMDTIPVHKAGNQLVFVKDEIDQWCEDRLANKNKNNTNALIISAQKKITK